MTSMCSQPTRSTQPCVAKSRTSFV